MTRWIFLISRNNIVKMYFGAVWFKFSGNKISATYFIGILYIYVITK